MAGIVMDELGFSYPNADVSALKDISINLCDPAAMLVHGPNLSGKTTLAKIILQVYLGQLDGKMLGRLDLQFNRSRERRIGFTFEDPNWMFCNLQVEDEIAFGLENAGVSPEEMRTRVDDCLERVGLCGFQSRQIATLSGGEAQKLAIAAALVVRPQIMVTDDFLSNLDVSSGPELVGLVNDYRLSEGCAWLNLSRRWSEADRGFDYLALLEGGSFAKVGSLIDVLAWTQTTSAMEEQFDLPPEQSLLRAVNQMLLLKGLPPIPSNSDPLVITKEVRERFVASRTPLHTMRNGAASSGDPGSLSLDSIRFGYTEKTPILKECSMQFYRGSINIVAGRNGSGKSTFAKIAAGLLRPDAGKVYWLGNRIDFSSLRERVSMVFQRPEYHFLTTSVLEEVRLSGRLLGLSARIIAQELEQLIDRTGLESKLNVSPFALSSGEQRRLAIAIALIRRPDVLIVDEPTLGQDERHAERLVALFADLRSAGVTVILVSHDASFIYECGDTINLVEAGSVIYSGSVPPLFDGLSKSDFSGKSTVFNLWSQWGRDKSVDPPRSLKGLLSRLVPVI